MVFLLRNQIYDHFVTCSNMKLVDRHIRLLHNHLHNSIGIMCYMYKISIHYSFKLLINRIQMYMYNKSIENS